MNREKVQEIRKKTRLDDKLLQYKGVVGVDVDHKQVKGQKTDKICITVYVKKKVGKEHLSADELVPSSIESIKSDVVECADVWPSPDYNQKFLSAQTKQELPEAPSPHAAAELNGGLSISNQYNLQSYGTLGVVISWNKVPTALSCAHVMVYPPPLPGQGVIEPAGSQGGTYPESSIGKVVALFYGVGTNVDAALVPIQGRPSKEYNIENIGNVTGFDNPQLGETVRKMGATTSFTGGVVGSTTLTWKYETELGPIMLKDQIRVDNIGQQNFGMPGDSGAVVVDSGLKMIGMIVSGTPSQFTVCNRSSDIQKVIGLPCTHSAFPNS